MGLFTNFQKKRVSQPDDHPAFQIGQRAGRWFRSQFSRAGQFLNTWQHRVGFRRRNYMVLGVLLIMFAYFIYDLLTLF